MTIWTPCPNGQRRKGSPCVFCHDGSYCGRQEYSSVTRRYEAVEWRRCKKGESPPTTAPEPDKKPLFERVNNVKVAGRELQFLNGEEILKSVTLPVVVAQGEEAATDEEWNEMFEDVFGPREQK